MALGMAKVFNKALAYHIFVDRDNNNTNDRKITAGKV